MFHQCEKFMIFNEFLFYMLNASRHNYELRGIDIYNTTMSVGYRSEFQVLMCHI